METLIVGDNILNYQVLRDLETFKNDITVYGAADTFKPKDQDSWTESLTNWSSSEGEDPRLDVPEEVGNYQSTATRDH